MTTSKKIVMLGNSAVGKTSLVRRFVKSIFDEKYLTTVGVKIDRRVVELEEETVNLILWDIHGEDEFQKIQTSYLRGAAGYFLVVDGTRRETWNTARSLQDIALQHMPKAVFSVLINKVDLEPEWEIGPEEAAAMESLGAPVQKTSAKTGEGVEEAFRELSRRMLGPAD